MPRTVEKFDFECDFQGASVIAVSDTLSPRCTSDAEIDAYIDQRKDELDEVRKEMKKAIRKELEAFPF